MGKGLKRLRKDYAYGENGEKFNYSKRLLVYKN